MNFWPESPKRAADFGYDLLVAVAHDKEDEISIYRKLISEGKVDGFVLTRTYCRDARAELPHKRGFSVRDVRQGWKMLRVLRMSMKMGPMQ